MTKRTQQQIVDRIKEVEKDDFFGFQSGDLIRFLDFEHAKEFLKDDVKSHQWKPQTDPIEHIKDYMPFAWDKANGCRGLSAGRSIEHMKAWLWLDGKEALADKLDSMYQYYGKPCLHAVCLEYGIDWKSLDNNEWLNDENETPLTAEEALK